MKYLVKAVNGPSFGSVEEAVKTLEGVVLPTFDQLARLEKEKRILAGGLPVGARALVFIADAASNEELDAMLRNLPMWSTAEWEVTALESFEGRAAQERDAVKKMKKKG